MHGPYDQTLMKRGEAACRLITQGEDPLRMLLAVVWPGHDWAEIAEMLACLRSCPRCSNGAVACAECGSTGLVTVARHQLLSIEALAASLYEAA